MTPDDADWADDGIVSLYIGTFAARDDLYVENGAGVKREPLSPEVLQQAVKHNYAVSGYLSTQDGRTHVGAIDFDTDNGLELAHTIRAFLDTHEIPASVMESRRGAHLWITSLGWVKTGTMHRMLKAAIALAVGQEAADDPKIEVFPKRGDDPLAVGALRIPGTPHQKTQVTYAMWLGGERFENPSMRQVIEGHMLTTPEAVERLAGKGPALAAYPKGLDGFYGYKEKRQWGEAPKASEILVEWGIPDAKPGGTVRCPKHPDRRRSLTVLKDDERVFCGSPACVLNGSGHGVGSVQLSKM